MCKEEVKEVKAIVVPYETMTFWGIIKDMPKRLLSMIHKLLGVKGLCLGLATWLLVIGILETWAWVLVVLIVIFGREALKFIAQIRG